MDSNEHNNNGDLPEEVGVHSHWIVIGETESRTVAEFAINGLKAYEIPAVLDSRAGALGSAGLSMRSLRTGKLETFRILVPPEFAEEGSEVINIFIGGEHTGENEPNTEEGEE
jgi:hypothetical protein